MKKSLLTLAVAIILIAVFFFLKIITVLIGGLLIALSVVIFIGYTVNFLRKNSSDE